MSGNFFQDELMVLTPRPAALGKSAYAYAVEGGYTGTEEDFAVKLAALLNDGIIGTFDRSTNSITITETLAAGTYKLYYRQEDGSLVEIQAFTVSEEDTSESEDTTETEPTPSYTNLADPDDSYWKEGYRLSISSGGTSACDGHLSTNFIPAKADDVVRIKGMTIAGGSVNSQYMKIVLYSEKDNESSVLGGLYGTKDATADCYGTTVTVDGDVSEVKLLYNGIGSQTATSATAYIRIDGVLLDGYDADDVIITVNEEIA